MGSNNISMTLDTQTLIKLNNDVKTSKTEIQSTIKKIDGCCDELKSNIKGTEVNKSLLTISGNITAIESKMSAAFDKLTAFLESQMGTYQTTYDYANTSLSEALSFIESNF